MRYFTIDKNDNGYHIHGLKYWYEGREVQPLYQTCHSYEDCIDWLDENYGEEYEVVENVQYSWSNHTYEDEIKVTEDFLDEIDIIPFMSDDNMIDVDNLMDYMEEYYNKGHSNLLPKIFRGDLFNFMNREEFLEYLGKRYGFKVEEKIVTKYYIIRQ